MKMNAPDRSVTPLCLDVDVYSKVNGYVESWIECAGFSEETDG